MARRKSDRMAAARNSGTGESFDDDEVQRESWLGRSTIYADEEDNDIGAGDCGWSQLDTPTTFNVAAPATIGGEAHVDRGFKEVEKVVSSAVCTRNGKRRLPLISGFANSAALRAQLPQSTSKQSPIKGSGALVKTKELRKTSEKVADCASSELLPSTDEVEANRRKWELERKLQDAHRSGNAMAVLDIPERKQDLRRKHQILYPVVPSAAEVEANQRKWDLERKLQDADRMGVLVDETRAPEQKPSLKRKLQTLNPYALKMNPAVLSAAEVEANNRKWDLERRLQDADRVGVSVDETRAGLKRKLQVLNPYAMKMNPVIPSAAEVETNRRKWDLERRLQDEEGFHAAVNQACAPQEKRDLRRKLQNLNPFAVTPDTPSSAGFEANQRKWDRESQLQEAGQSGTAVTVSGAFEKKCDSMQKLPTLNMVASSVAGGESRLKKWKSDRSLCNLEDQLEKKMVTTGGDDAGRRKAQAFASVDGHPERREFGMSESLVYLLLFTSTAVLHCAIFNFNMELRQFLRLDSYPFGVLLLLCWTVVGLIHFVGGLVGDLVHNRVALLQRTTILWGVAVVALHVAAFDFTPEVSSISLVSGFLFAGVAHGIICPNVVALMVETKLRNFRAVTAPFSPEEVEEASSSEDDSAAESEASYLSDVSTALSDDQQECDVASHNFFAGCFAAKLAGFSLMQAYYFLLVNVDMFPNEGSEGSRGFYCMLFMSFALMISFIFFCFQSWGYHASLKVPGEFTAGGNFEDQRLQHKLARLEMEITTSADTFLSWSWGNLVYLCNRALIGYALVAFVLITLIGVAFSLIVVLLASQTSLSVRLVAFLLIITGWLLTMIATSRQLNPTKKKLLRVCRRFGFRSRQLYLIIFAAAFICVSGCVAFLRAQLYTTLVVQVCQTRLLIPGTISTLIDPDLLGTAVGTSSLVLLGLARVLTKNRIPDQVEFNTQTKANLFVPSTSVLPKTRKRPFMLPSLVSCLPVTRMCFAMLLYLISIFLSSVVELYRRKALVSPSALPRSCGAVHSEFSFLWTSPYVVLLGASDALFRVSLQEVCHDLARGSFSSMPSRRWAGAVQGAISLAESLGYTTALSLVAVLSRWLFRPEPTDMALLFLLLTTAVALTHALLNRIAARAQAYQRLLP